MMDVLELITELKIIPLGTLVSEEDVSKICNCLMLLSLCCIPHFGIAQTIQIPVASQGGAHATLDRPQTGLSGEAVLERFGEPLNTTPAVGEPPISRWEYAEFYVYFEYSHVVHTVLKHKPTR